jgi:hypothetical protein
MTAEEVAKLLDARVEDVRRFEGPVLAEREHIIGRALAVPVLMGVELNGEPNPTFGTAIRSKLADVNATGERWTSWKDESGWIIKVEFEAAEVEHDARWSFDPRRSALAPLNSDATQLSRQGPIPEGLVPRLRALDAADRDETFDSGAFGAGAGAETDDATDGMTRAIPSVRDAATKRAPHDGEPNPDTADLLEALRRRRGQRETAPLLPADGEAAEQPSEHAGNPPVSLFAQASAEEEPAPEESHEDERPESPSGETEQPRRRGGRAAMPSWDEIVFGARADD